MVDSMQERRLDILANPTETLRIECKTWLDLNDNHDNAVIAKAAKALANSDGGTIVFGVTKERHCGFHYSVLRHFIAEIPQRKVCKIAIVAQ